jgi:predicted SnoaL-like aldol condensation-catalyzing enzyme
MKSFTLSILLSLAAMVPVGSYAQVAVTPNANHEQMLVSSDAKAAANKRLVYDFWREVFEGGHMELAEKYMAESYIQHNPNVPTGRAAFIEFFRQFVKPKPIEARVKAPLVAIVADGDYVVLSFVSAQPDPKDSTRKYTTTWFDMFRIENGKIAEHWDPALKGQ